MALFDESGRLLPDADLKSVQFGPSGRTVPKEKVDRATDTKYMQVLDQRTGEQAGAHREHGSGRIDAIVTPQPVRTQSKANEE